MISEHKTSVVRELSVYALLVIDVQENYLNPLSFIHIDTTGVDLFLSNMNHVIDVFSANNNHVIYVVNEWTNPIMNFFTNNVSKKGEEGVGIDNRLNVINNNIYSKSKPNSLSNKDLLTLLRTNNITDVYVIGLMTEGCINATVEGLIKENFNVIVVKDALGYMRAGKHNKTIKKFEKRNIKLIETKDIAL